MELNTEACNYYLRYVVAVAIYQSTQQFYNCAETHLGCGVMSPFVFPLLPSLEHKI